LPGQRVPAVPLSATQAHRAADCIVSTVASTQLRPPVNDFADPLGTPLGRLTIGAGAVVMPPAEGDPAAACAEPRGAVRDCEHPRTSSPQSKRTPSAATIRAASWRVTDQLRPVGAGRVLAVATGLSSPFPSPAAWRGPSQPVPGRSSLGRPVIAAPRSALKIRAAALLEASQLPIGRAVGLSTPARRALPEDVVSPRAPRPEPPEQDTPRCSARVTSRHNV
jgi:hypothetical protein